MVNEEIVGGLVSALSRGEPLEKGMMTFYNAGYEKDEIEEAAKVVYSQLGAQAMGIKGSLQDTLNQIALKAGALSKPKSVQNTPQKMEASPEEMRLQLQRKSPELNPLKDIKEQAPQNVSAYGENKISGSGTNAGADELMDKIQKAIKELKPVNIPSKIEIINKNIESKPDKEEKRVSDYREDASKPVSKMLTYILVFILLLLLGLLGAVFFFKDELIRIFNNAGLA